MSHRTVLQSIVAVAFLILPSALLRAQSPTDQAVEVVFTQDMDAADLIRIQEELKAKGIDLRITNKNFNDGLLRDIAFTVSTPKGSGNAEGDIKAGGRFGFRYDPRPEAEAHLRLGSLDAPRRKATAPAEAR